jgi:short-subunit dehydrogenase
MTFERAKPGRLARTFIDTYGPWALIAGASEGIGAAYARALAAQGLNLLVVARRRDPLEQLADSLRREFHIDVACHPGDLACLEFLEELVCVCSALDLGLLVYNAAHSPVGEFVHVPCDDLARVVDVNVRGPVVLVRSLVPQMMARGRGGVVLMSSLAGMTGAPRVASYAASKAFNRILAQSLWYELKDHNIDVVACISGAARTPGYSQAADKDAPGTLDPEQVVDQTLRALGRRPAVVPGVVNRMADILLGRVLSRKAAINLMGASTRGVVHEKRLKGPA